MVDSWFYVHDGAQKGPVSRDDLRLAVSRGEMEPRSQVWREGMDQWRPLEDVEELRLLLAPASAPIAQGPPPLPPQALAPPAQASPVPLAQGPPPLPPQAAAPPVPASPMRLYVQRAIALILLAARPQPAVR